MNIGVDIDGVLIDNDKYITEDLSKFLYENNLPEIDKPNEFERKASISEEERKKFGSDFWVKYIVKAKPVNYAKEVLEILKKRGHKIFIVTARFWTNKVTDPKFYEWAKKTTIKWLNKYKIPYDEVCFAEVPKNPMIIKNNIDVMCEDALENIPELVKVTKVACFDAPHNKNYNHKNLFRVYSWYDFLSKFDKLYKNKSE